MQHPGIVLHHSTMERQRLRMRKSPADSPVWPRERQAVLWGTTPLTWMGESSLDEIILTSFAYMLMGAFFLSAKAGQPCPTEPLPKPGRLLVSGLALGLSPACSHSEGLLQPGTHHPAPSIPADRPMAAWGGRLDFGAPSRSLLKSHLCVPALFHSIHFGQGAAPQHLVVWGSRTSHSDHSADRHSFFCSFFGDFFFNPWITFLSNSFIVCSLNYVHPREVNPVPSVPTVIINSS